MPYSQHLGGRGWWILEFAASLVYRVSSRTVRATQRNPVSKKKKEKKLPRLALNMINNPSVLFYFACICRHVCHGILVEV
jgi:hypothetical protein